MATAYVVMLVAWPTALVFKNAFAGGLGNITAAFSNSDILISLQLTAEIAVASVVCNLVFGVGIALLLVRYRFPGKRLLSALLDVPLSVSPVVVGLALVLVYSGVNGWLGPTLERWGIQVIFALPGMIMATTFVALPLVIREVVPVLEELGDEQEQAARSLGAGSWQTFCRITLPGIKWAVTYGVVLSFARALGEFGAVKIVSGNVVGQTQTATLAVEQTYQNFQQGQAYAVAALLALTAMACLVVVAVLRPKEPSS